MPDTERTVSTATASSIYNGGYPASAAIDGNVGTRWVANTSQRSEWLLLDMGSAVQSSMVAIYFDQVDEYWTVYGTNDLFDFELLVDHHLLTVSNGWNNLRYPPRTYRYLLLVHTGGSGGGDLAALEEVKVWDEETPLGGSAPGAHRLMTEASFGGKTHTASSQYSVRDPDNATRLRFQTWHNNENEHWLGSAPNQNDWWKCDFGAEVTLSHVIVFTSSTAESTYTIEVSPNDTDWYVVGSVAGINDPYTPIESTFSPVLCRYVRLTHSVSGGSHYAHLTSVFFEYDDGDVGTAPGGGGGAAPGTRLYTARVGRVVPRSPRQPRVQ